MTHSHNSACAASLLIFLLLFALLLAACEVDGDTVEKVDDAVKLLQDVDRNGTWGYLTDGLDTLVEQDGYVAVIDYEYLEFVDGELVTPDDSKISIQITHDGTGAMRFEFTDRHGTYLYYSPAPSPDADTRKVYQIDATTFTCPTAADTQLYANGIVSILAFYDVREVLTATLSVAEADGDSTTWLDRDANHYILESRLPEALDILERTDNAELRERIAATKQETIAGAFDLDEATGALLFFDNVYVFGDLTQQRSLMFSVTQWGDVPDIVPNGPLPACE